jgi:hypothetical protein
MRQATDDPSAHNGCLGLVRAMCGRLRVGKNLHVRQSGTNVSVQAEQQARGCEDRKRANDHEGQAPSEAVPDQGADRNAESDRDRGATCDDGERGAALLGATTAPANALALGTYSPAASARSMRAAISIL